MYNTRANDLAEAFNKILGNLLKKVVAKSKRDWHERLGEALWAYRMTYKTPTQSTPFASVYGVEVALPLELQIPSFCIAMQESLKEEENHKLRLDELEALDEKRLRRSKSWSATKLIYHERSTKKSDRALSKLETKCLQ